jgi:hypothetical protein
LLLAAPGVAPRGPTRERQADDIRKGLEMGVPNAHFQVVTEALEALANGRTIALLDQFALRGNELVMGYVLVGGGQHVPPAPHSERLAARGVNAGGGHSGRRLLRHARTWPLIRHGGTRSTRLVGCGAGGRQSVSAHILMQSCNFSRAMHA